MAAAGDGLRRLPSLPANERRPYFVMETCSDLRNRDFKAVVHERSVGDLDPQAHALALQRMRKILEA